MGIFDKILNKKGQISEKQEVIKETNKFESSLRLEVALRRSKGLVYCPYCGKDVKGILS